MSPLNFHTGAPARTSDPRNPPHQTYVTSPTVYRPIAPAGSSGGRPSDATLSIQARTPRHWSHMFIEMLPRSDNDWNARLSTNVGVQRIFNKLTLSYLYPHHRASLSWPEMFNECITYIRHIRERLHVATFFSFVFISACHIAHLEGVSDESINDALRSFFLAFSDSVLLFEDWTLLQIRRDNLIAIRLISECTRNLGYRAYELPMHSKFCHSPLIELETDFEVPNRLPLALYCNPETLADIKVRLLL